ncbi:MAG: thiol peroxidase [Myxococcota bacterium]|jgi:thiol peroxidase|nr:thiol peroxidase [Myxococcota bacterium]MBP8971884.1 thiol peroxidase [Myxococcota bacterium]OQC42873.1 MAG: putative thiol peroxidase [Deltaproteobacteria bacterium ADurb.Bin058]
MAKITLQGNEINTIGELPKVGSKLPAFKLTKGDLSDVSLADFAGKKLIFNIVPSLDTGVCAASAKRFEAEVQKLVDTVVLTVSNDLPFAQDRFCKAEDITNVVTLSQLRDRAFGRDFGVEIVDGPLAGLLSRAVVVADKAGNVIYTQQVPEIVQEPDYTAVLDAVR